MDSRKIRSAAAGAALFLAAAGLGLQGQSADKVGKLFEKFAWRGIGPALMGGRTVDIDAVERTPWIIYAAVGPSGVWKSENNGTTWAPVFFKETTVSVGDVTIAQSSPDTIWVGTGEATCRNSVTIGDGVYKSTDGGKSWTNMGLRETRHISRILVGRGDPNVVYVAAMGHLWGPNPDRGVFKTIDGGKSWAKVLYIDENTGIADLAMDPADSLVLYAAAYDYRRQPWSFVSGGKGSGILRTQDGGLTWTRLSKDLPEGMMGRIGLGVARSKPGLVYALIENKDGGIWRSEDQGETWKRTCDSATFKRANNRPFYYSQIIVDPSDDKKIYVLSTGAYVSEDMGQKFRGIAAGVHSDHHALWVDPQNPLHLIDGNDGGIDMSYDGGRTWLAVQSIDASEVYQVGYDLRNPYFVTCGLQDNGSWAGPSRSLDPKGIVNEDWTLVSGGDGFSVKPDPSNPDTIYANYQMNGLSRYDLRIGRGKSIRPAASLSEPPYRFNWNSPVLISPHDSKTVYCGGNFLFRTQNGGNSWEKMSPDLTSNDPSKQKDGVGPFGVENSGAEMYCTIVTISESPVEKGVLWCGTDDGYLQVTRDGGASWKNVAEAIPGLPAGTWCSRVEASHFDAGTAYAAFDGHRRDDYATYAFKTTDFGKTWKSIRGNLPFGWVHVIREDLKNKNLLFAGTEFGIFGSLDGGGSWFSLKNNLPTAAVHDIAIHPRENDLIIGTHCRGIWILDDISFIQMTSDSLLATDFNILPIRSFTSFFTSSKGEQLGRAVFAGKNPPSGLIITTWMKTDLKEKGKLLVKDQASKIIHEMNLNQKAGFQRETWNLQFSPQAKDGKKYSPGLVGFSALPDLPDGQYTLETTIGEKAYSANFAIYPDPRVDIPAEAQKARMEMLSEILRVSQKTGLATTAGKNIRRHLDAVKKDLPPTEGKFVNVSKALADFEALFSKVEKDIIPGDIFSFFSTWEVSLRGGTPLILMLTTASSILGYPDAPTQTESDLLNEIFAKMNSAIVDLNQIIRDEIPRLNTLLEGSGLKAFPKIEQVAI